MSKLDRDNGMTSPKLRNIGLDVDLSSTTVFEFDGKKINGYKGDTIASALYAAGTRIFSRSFKYHSPRGLLCVEGNCPNCFVFHFFRNCWFLRYDLAKSKVWYQ